MSEPLRAASSVHEGSRYFHALSITVGDGEEEEEGRGITGTDLPACDCVLGAGDAGGR